MAWINKEGYVEYHSKERSRIKDTFCVFGTKTNIVLGVPSKLRGKEFKLKVELQ